MWQASILVRALVHGWRHMGGAHTPVEGVAAALAIGLDSRPLSVGIASVSHTKRRKQVAASLASRRKRGDLTPPAVVASRDEPAVLRTRSQRLPGLSTAESDPFEPLDATT